MTRIKARREYSPDPTVCLGTVRVKRRVRRIRRRRHVEDLGGGVFYQLPITPAGKITVPDTSLSTLLKSLAERVLYQPTPAGWREPIKPTEAAVRMHLGWELDYLKSHARKIAPWSLAQFVEHATGRQRVIYEACRLRLQETTGLEPTCKCGRTRAFVKIEKVDAEKLDFIPRMIQATDVPYRLLAGRYIKPMERPIYEALDLMCDGPSVMKGYNAEGMARMMAEAWFSIPDCACLGLDASKFDRHVSKEILNAFEHKVLLSWCAGPRRRLAQLLHRQLQSRGVALCDEAVVHYGREGGRRSGDPNTALGNCLIMVSMVHALLREQGVVGYRLFDNGDDCLIFANRLDLLRLEGVVQRWFEEMGFLMKIEPIVRTLEHVEFCQMHPICVDGTWRLVRKPKTVLAKDSTFIKPLGGRAWVDYWHTVAVGGIALCSGVPVLQNFYQYLHRLGKGGRLITDPTLESGWRWLAGGMPSAWKPISRQTRWSFYLAYGIDPDLQGRLENLIDNWPDCVPLGKTQDTVADEVWHLL